MLPQSPITRMSSTITSLLAKRRLRPWIMLGLGVAVVVSVFAIAPSHLEENRSSNSSYIDPKSLASEDQATLATGIPTQRIPEYSVDEFKYASTVGSEKQWKIIADRAFLNNAEKLVHARQIHAYIYDPDGQTTLVTGKEAKFFMNQRDLEIFGDVHTTFPDGFELISDYLRYLPNERKVIIPDKYHVAGDGHEKEGQNIQFTSMGFDFAMGRSEIILPENVHMTMIKQQAEGGDGVPDRTVIDSDHAVIHRDKQIADFTMSPARPLSERFVRITQPTLFTRSRRARINYGDFSQMLQYLIAYEDVFIKELPGKKTGAQPGPTATASPAPESLRYATGGRADFDSKSDVIKLTEFPQCYQDNDTVTGDIIIMHRDTDLVEVEHSNAFSQGNQ
jgi:LPS export ABC transporter protein LptC